MTLQEHLKTLSEYVQWCHEGCALSGSNPQRKPCSCGAVQAGEALASITRAIVDHDMEFYSEVP
jgi:hypothetical protein